MFRGDSRQLLILGVPTITLVFGILFLRHRRRKRGTLHTDPGGISRSILNQELSANELAASVIVDDLEKNGSFSAVAGNSAVEELIPAVEERFAAVEASLDDSVELVEAVVPRSESLEASCEGDHDNKGDSRVTSTEGLNPVDVHVTTPVAFVDLTEASDPGTDKEGSYPTESDVPLIRNHSISKDSECAELTESLDKLTAVEEDTQNNKEASIDEAHDSDNISCKGDSSAAVEIVTTASVSENCELNPTEQEGHEGVSHSTDSVAREDDKHQETAEMKKGETGELVDKLVNLELDSMNMSGRTEEKRSCERDSANHSPSEVMLASPSISNFSDAHSEGSSDSGKGHSDVATSPSRTPAGGSSLAGDALSVYEFICPQAIVGRLIGRHGTSLQEIRSTTGTNIFIKRHPDTIKLKICAIEGTVVDIDRALAKIRQKFPLRRFPQLTLEQVSFACVVGSSASSLRSDSFRLHLIEGVNNDVILSSLISAAHFFLQQPSHPSYASLVTLNAVMNSVYSSPAVPVLDPPIVDAVCAAPTMGGWYRAQIISVDEENHTSYVRFLDYGGYLVVNSSSLRQIRGDFLTLPFQAVECYMANVAPADGEYWSEEARLFVQSVTHGQLLQAQIYDYSEDGAPLVYLYSSHDNEVILINEELIARGYATLIPAPAEEKETELCEALEGLQT